MNGSSCFVCSKSESQVCERCGFISYCGDACREADHNNHYPICGSKQRFFLRGGYYVGTFFLMMVNPRRAQDKKYELHTMLVGLHLNKPECPESLVAALSTLQEPSEYVRSDMAKFVRWMLYCIDPDKTIRKRVIKTVDKMFCNEIKN